MNFQPWSTVYSPFYPMHPPTSSTHPFTLSPQYSTGMFNSSMNMSSGYESGSRETSFCSPTSDFRVVPLTGVQSTVTSDSAMEDEVEQSATHGRKKRRVLSRPQRQEANRRERHRMEIINRAYEDLRNALPFKKGRKRQRMSRMDTVEGAIRYIESLLEMLHGPNYQSGWTMS